MKIYRRRYEFSAHAANVNCLRLGRGSGLGLVTGGDDHKVNIWKLGHSHPLASLHADSSPIDSVGFDSSDEYAVSGNGNGVVSVWDIPQEKVGRQFSGHQDRVTSVQYHPNKGYYIVSGSADSVVKVWDVRRKACLHSFYGNSKLVTRCSFSPDGKWICAGFADGEVKLWDIRSRKLLQSYRQHKGKISGIEFHPTECLMATASFDGSVRLWDLENAETIEKIGPEHNEVRCIQFSKEGDCLLSGMPDGLRSHGWEPYQLYDSVSIPWPKICDMAIWHAQKKLVVCTSDHTRVGVWLVDLKKLRPFSQHEVKTENSKTRRNEVIPALKIDPVFEMRDSDSSSRTSTGRFSEKYSAFGTERSSKGAADSDRLKVKSMTERSSSVRSHFKESDSERLRIKVGERSLSVRSQSKEINSDRTTNTVFERSPSTHSQSMESDRDMGRTPMERSPSNKSSTRTPHKKLDLSEVRRSCVEPPSVDPTPFNRTFTPSHDRASMTSRAYSEKKHFVFKECDRYALKTERQAPKKEGGYASRDINIESFMPKKNVPISLERPTIEPDDAECIDDMMTKKDMVRHILSSRVCNLQIIRRFWEQGDMKETLKAVRRCENPSVTVDFMDAVSPLQKILTLELIPCLVPLLLDMLQSSHEKYWETALRILLLVLKGLGGLIRETINGASMSTGVNISLEQRLEKCRSAQEHLLATLPLVERIAKQDGNVAVQAKDVQGRLCDLTT